LYKICSISLFLKVTTIVHFHYATVFETMPKCSHMSKLNGNLFLSFKFNFPKCLIIASVAFILKLISFIIILYICFVAFANCCCCCCCVFGFSLSAFSKNIQRGGMNYIEHQKKEQWICFNQMYSKMFSAFDAYWRNANKYVWIIS